MKNKKLMMKNDSIVYVWNTIIINDSLIYQKLHLATYK